MYSNQVMMKSKYEEKKQITFMSSKIEINLVHNLYLFVTSEVSWM